MGFILIGILMLALAVKIAWDYDNYILVVLSVFATTVLVVLGICVPISGYNEPQVESESVLVALRDDTVSVGSGRMCYVSVSGTNSYTYYVEIESPYASDSQVAYKSVAISDDNVTIIEDDNCTEPRIVEYVIHGKKSFWTFAVVDEYEYVFYVPTGTIARDVSLG